MTALGITEQGVIDDILRAMNARNMSQRALATSMGVSEARVSQMLRVGSNMRIRTIERVWFAILKWEIAEINKRSEAEFAATGFRLFGHGFAAKHARAKA